MIFKSISISKKITGSMVILLFTMLSITVISFFKIQKTDNELKILAKHVIPLSNLIAKIDTHSLEQEIILERILKHYELKQPDKVLIEKELNDFETRGRKVDEEIKNGEKLLKAALKEVNIKEDAIELAKMVPLLKMVEKEHQDFHDHVLKTIALRKKNGMTRFHTDSERLDKEIDELDDILKQVVTIIGNLSEKESKDVMVGELLIHEVSLIVSAVIFLIGLIIAPRISKGIVAPLKKIIIGAESISNGDLDIEIPVTSKDEVGQLSISFNNMAKELKQKEQIKETFGKYVDPRIVEGLLKGDGKLDVTNSQKKEMTIFFSDIEKFSTISEELTPDGLVTLINRYFSLVSEPIAHYNGVIDKFIGDAVMAFWGPPFTDEEGHAKLACQAALEQFAKIDELNDSLADLLGFRKGLPKINIRIGLCTGDVIAGNIGSSHSKSFTVMGDTVNIAARLESANKQFGTRILMSDTTYEASGDAFETRKIDNIIVVGKFEPVFVYELIGLKNKVEKQVIELVGLYEKAYLFYQQTDWDNANKHLNQCLEINPEDKPTQVLIDRINQFRLTPPPDNWDGVWRMTKK